MVYQFIAKKSKGSGFKSVIKQTEQLAEQLAKPSYQKIQNKKNVYSSFKDNIWGADLADV